MFLFAKHAAEEKIGVREQLRWKRQGAVFFKVSVSSGGVGSVCSCSQETRKRACSERFRTIGAWNSS
jgi:hypothetical protein